MTADEELRAKLEEQPPGIIEQAGATKGTWASPFIYNPPQEKPLDAVRKHGWGMSDDCAKLFSALSQAREEMGALITSKSATVSTASGGTYSYTFATLADCWDVIRKPLKDHGLAITQLTLPPQGEASVAVVTILGHESGQWLASTTRMKIDASARSGSITPQDVGKAYTYARRYGLVAIVGLYQEDDDGNSASGHDAQIDDRQRPPKGGKKQEPKKEAADKPKLAPANDIESWPMPSIATKDLDHFGRRANYLRMDELPALPAGLAWPVDPMPKWEDYAYRKAWHTTSGFFKDLRPCDLLDARDGTLEIGKLNEAREAVVRAAQEGKALGLNAYIPVLILGVLEREQEQGGSA